METANRYDFLCDTEGNDLQAILKKKAKKAKKAAKKLAGKENSDNDGKMDTKSDKSNDEKKVKFVVPGRGKQLQQEQQPPKSRSMKDTQNIKDNGNFDNGFSEIKRNFDRERHNGNNRNYEHRVQRQWRNKDDGGTESFDNFGGNRPLQQNGFGPSNRGNRSNTNGYRNNENNNAQDMEYNQQINNQRERNDERPPRRQGNDRNFGNRRYEGQRRNYDGRGGKREFDRQSGSDKTGVKAVEKREGGGAHNWGTHKQDMEDLNTETEVKDEVIVDEKIKSQENLAVQEVVLTLDEYKQQQGERAKPVYNTRKAGEGEDKKKWKNMVRLDNTKKNEDDDEYELEYDPSQYPQRKGKIRVLDTIEVRFNDTKRRNNRRNNRDFNGRRNDENKRQNAPQIDDDRNFPSLG